MGPRYHTHLGSALSPRPQLPHLTPPTAPREGVASGRGCLGSSRSAPCPVVGPEVTAEALPRPISSLVSGDDHSRAAALCSGPWWLCQAARLWCQRASCLQGQLQPRSPPEQPSQVEGYWPPVLFSPSTSNLPASPVCCSSRSSVPSLPSSPWWLLPCSRPNVPVDPDSAPPGCSPHAATGIY